MRITLYLTIGGICLGYFVKKVAFSGKCQQLLSKIVGCDWEYCLGEGNWIDRVI